MGTDGSVFQRLFKSAKQTVSGLSSNDKARTTARNLPPRKIYTNMEVPADDLPDHAKHFCTNAITTSQYTYINFLPKNLSRQFRRVANVYFLVLTVLQLFNYFAVGSKFLTVIPIILVLTITALKDAFEDWRRHISDKHFNETKTRVVRNLHNPNLLWQDQQAEAAKSNRILRMRINNARRLGKRTIYNQLPAEWEESRFPVDASQPPLLDEESKWRNVRVGDFVLLKTGDPAPADILLLSTSAEDGGCYVETKNLDGETNLKPRTSLVETNGLRAPADCGMLRAVCEVDPPSEQMFKMNGSIQIHAVPRHNTGDAKAAFHSTRSPLSKATMGTILGGDDQSHMYGGYEHEYETMAGDRPPQKGHMTNYAPPLLVPFTVANVLLRGMTVRNTDWIIGVVLYTGEQTKIVLNSGPTPYKRSRIERRMNKQVLLGFAYVFVLSFVCALVGGIKFTGVDQRNSAYVDQTMGDGVYGFALFWSAMIMLQNIIPISLYVSIEFVRSWHAYWIYEDINMYYEPTDQRCAARNWNISDDLGQVSYIFSDKTGTLTRNVMDFRMCTIDGKIYGKQLPGDELDVVKGRIAQEEVDRNNPPEGGVNPFFTELQDEPVDSIPMKRLSRATSQYQTKDTGLPLDYNGRPSTNSSLISNGTSQYDSSPLISTSDHSVPHPVAVQPTRTRTIQPLTEAEARDKRRAMIGAYLSAMRSAFDPKFVEIGDEETGEGGAYTFVDPQLFRDMASNDTRQRAAVDLFFTELATCHAVVIEKGFERQTDDGAEDDTSTIQRFTRMFHSRNSSKKLSNMVRHRRHRSKHHGHSESVDTMGSGAGVSWVPSDAALAESPSSMSTSPSPDDIFVRMDKSQSTGSHGSLPHTDSSASGWQNRSNSSPEPPENPRLAYSAESPDEGALVRAAKNFGYTFLGRVKNTLYLDIKGERVQYEVLDTIEFTSTRKRMSVVLRRPAPYNDIVLFSKGADNVMIERLFELSNDSSAETMAERQMRERTFLQIDEFANAGLRTLVLAYRSLTEDEWIKWSARFHAAQASLDDDRDDKIARAADEIERDLRIVGATAIEDKLQERVPDTIASLRAAGIKIWVLTGDKMETAINIGFAANLLTKEMELWTISSSEGTDKVLARFHLIARIVQQTAANDLDFTKRKRHTRPVGISAHDASALGSISYKIKNARKFIHAKHSTDTKDNTRDSEYEMSPDEVRRSMHYLRRQSTIISAGLGDPADAELEAKAASSNPLSALVIDGAALSVVLADSRTKQLLVDIAPLFKSVVCCRASPLQKAEVVKLIKDGLDLVTLAIGDGANDVSMIQTADIGVAISGEEGLQASMASDYSFGRFHYLQNLLLVHGLFDYLRMSEMILTFFYKNIIWAMVPFWFNIYCSFSANVFYDLSYIQLYNVVFTVAPVVILGCVDKPFNYKTAMTYIAVYMDGIRNSYFKWWRYFMYMLDGIYQSVVIFFTFYLFTYKSTISNDNGKIWNISDLSTGPTVSVVIAASLCVGFNSWQWNWIMIVAIILSIVVCLAYIAIGSQVRYFSIEGAATAVMSTVDFWFGVVFSVVLALLPRYCVKSWQKINRPRDLDIVREIKVLHRPWYGQVFIDPENDPQFQTSKKRSKRPVNTVV